MPPTTVRPAVVRVARGDPADPASSLLAEALAAKELDRALSPGRRTSGHAVVCVAISPPAPVAATLVHELVDLLHERGWARVDVGASLTALDRDRGHRQLPAIAREAGLLGSTRTGRAYGLVDLREDLVQATVPDSSVLCGQPVSQAWQEADLRILLSRNVTDPFDGYALGLQLLLGVAPPVPGADRSDVAADLCRYLGPQLSIVDATVSSDGEAGDCVLSRRVTATVLAGSDALLVDLVGAGLQGIDPGASRLFAAALAQSGMPAPQRIEGDLTPYDGWTSAHPLLRAMAQDIDGSAGLSRVLALLMASADGEGRETGPPDPVLGVLRSALAPLLAGRGDPGQRAWVAGAGYTLAELAAARRAWTSVLAKDSVEWVEKPLGFDPGDYGDAAYDELPQFLSPFARMLDDLPAGDGGVQWCELDGATVFRVARTIPAPYDEFVARVDIAAGISLMADYLGGRVVVISRDDDGRPVRQAERNVYLPQPNYLALWGGKSIDVAKIELVERGEDWSRLSWRTVRSPNGSASYDDGSLTFTAAGPDAVRVEVMGRQLFALPAYWQGVDLERFPEVRDVLVEDAYRRFFTATFDNLESCYEGREFRVGRPPPDPEGPLPTAALAAGLDVAKDWLAERTRGSAGSRRGRGADVWGRVTDGPGRDEGVVDAAGFRHFPGR